MKMCHKKDNVFKLDDNARRKIIVNESRYIALFVVSRSIKKLFSIQKDSFADVLQSRCS